MAEALNQAIEAWLGSLVTVKPGTVKEYRSTLKLFQAWCADDDLDIFDVTKDDVARWRLHLQQLGRAPATILRRVGDLRLFYIWLLDEGRIESNPVMPLPSSMAARSTTAIGALSLRDVRVLLSATANDRERATLLLMLVGGLIGADLEAAKASDLQQTWRGWELRLPDRRIPLPSLVSEPLLAYLDGRTHGPLIANNRGRTLDRRALTRILNAVGQRARLGIDLQPSIVVNTMRAIAITEPIPLCSLLHGLGEGSFRGLMARAKTFPESEQHLTRRMALVVDPSRDTTEGALDLAESLAWTQGHPPASRLMIAGAVFERHLRTLAIARGAIPPDIDKTGLAMLAARLNTAKVFTNTDQQTCVSIETARNYAAHGWNELVTDDLAAVTIEKIRRLVALHPLDCDPERDDAA